MAELGQAQRDLHPAADPEEMALGGDKKLGVAREVRPPGHADVRALRGQAGVVQIRGARRGARPGVEGPSSGRRRRGRRSLSGLVFGPPVALPVL
eukprot:5025448-Pyramimonas_sp.AAC.1